MVKGKKTYRIEVDEYVWADFRKTLMKDDVINDIFIEFIKDRIKKFKDKK